MKSFWENLFFDLDEGNLDQEGFAETAGQLIREDLSAIETAIRDFDLIKALNLVADFKRCY